MIAVNQVLTPKVTQGTVADDADTDPEIPFSNTLDELLDVIDEAKDKAEEAEEQLEVIEGTLEKYKVSDLKSMLKEKGLPVSGNKAELIERLEASE